MPNPHTPNTLSWRRNAEIRKRDDAKQLVLGEVYVPHDPNDPDTIDSQGHAATADEIQKAAHAFLADCRQDCVDRDHDGVNQHGHVVESYLAKQDDPLFKQGAWVVGIRVTDTDTWNAVENGDITGISLAGEAELIPAHQENHGPIAKQDVPQTPLKIPTHWLRKLRVHALSLVDKPANKRPLRIYKRDQTAQNNALKEMLQETLERQEKRTAKLAEELINIRHQLTQITKAAGISAGERAQAREEAYTNTDRNANPAWEDVTDGFGFLKEETLRKSKQGD